MQNETKKVERKGSLVFKILSILFLSSLMSNVFLVKQCRDDEQIAKRKARSELAARFTLEEQGETYRLVVTNLGDRRADSIWLYQQMYFVTGDEVYTCNDLPHFHYRCYNGSRTKMFSLGIGSDTTITLDFPCFRSAAGQIVGGQGGQLVTCWNIEYDDRQHTRRNDKFYFVYDAFHRPQSPDKIGGGIGCIEQVQAQERYGPTHYIDYVAETGYFEKDPPRNFEVLDNGQRRPLDHLSQVPIGGVVEIHVRLEDGLLSCQGPSYAGFVWTCVDGRLSKAITFSRFPFY